jgi:hypothetical protein
VRGHGIKDITGQVFGSLTVISISPVPATGRRSWQCKCVCGSACVVEGTNLRRGNTQSCGCLHKQRTSAANTTHGQARPGKHTPEYRAFCGARNRCKYKNGKDYHSYGGRGIEFRFTSVDQLIQCIGLRPTSKHSLDRFPNNDGHYEPGNVRWATKKEQANNRSRAIKCPHCGQTFQKVGG